MKTCRVPQILLLLGFAIVMMANKVGAEEGPVRGRSGSHKAEAQRELSQRLTSGVAGLLRPLCPDQFPNEPKSAVPRTSSLPDLRTFDELAGIQKESRRVLLLYALDRIGKDLGPHP